MKKLVIHSDRIADARAFAALCPFGALETAGGAVSVSSGCRMCGLCVKNCGNGEAEFVETAQAADKSSWSGICVYADHENGALHPVTFELLGKARELAARTDELAVGALRTDGLVACDPNNKCKVYALLIGDGCLADELLHYGADEVHVYGDRRLDAFNIETYTAVFNDFVWRARPSVILVGATQAGRQLAPRVAARLETGLTADCTFLDIGADSGLIQIRPAFGGNIMARIATPNHRPQMATVRYKVMKAPERGVLPSGRLVRREAAPGLLATGIEQIASRKKERAKNIENAEVIVAVGRGLRSAGDVGMARRLAELLGGELACTRPLAENGWVEPRRQIGLSGRTVRPKLLIACGVSGAVQFTAGMGGAEHIFAINRDESAGIFKTAHVGAVGDLYEIVPALIARIEGAL